MSDRNLRDYGLGESTGMVRGVPRVGDRVTQECPNCHCRTLFWIEVDVVNPLLIGGKGLGNYMGCAACPWASPMLMAAVGRKQE